MSKKPNQNQHLSDAQLISKSAERGTISIPTLSSLAQFPVVVKLVISEKIFTDEKEGSKKPFAGLKEVNLLALHIIADAELSVDACNQLGDNLPDSLETLSWDGCKSQTAFQALTEKLAGKNIKVLSFTNNRILDFSPLVKVLPQMPHCTHLTLTGDPSFSEGLVRADKEAKGMSELIELCTQPTSKITMLGIDCSSKPVPATITTPAVTSSSSSLVTVSPAAVSNFSSVTSSLASWAATIRAMNLPGRLFATLMTVGSAIKQTVWRSPTTPPATGLTLAAQSLSSPTSPSLMPPPPTPPKPSTEDKSTITKKFH